MARRLRQEKADRDPKTFEAAGKAGRESRVQVLVDGVPIELSPELEDAVHRAHKGLCQSLPSEMTTTEAAAFLDVSRPFVIKLIERGELPCRMVGKHRRIPSQALEEYRDKMFRQAKRAADDMARASQEMGFYELDGPAPKTP